MSKLVIESYGAFINEAKKAKKAKKESFISKADINKTLKSIGFGFVKMQKDSYHDVTHRSKQQGKRGGSIGPMTATSAYARHNSEVVDEVRMALYKLGGRQENTYSTLSMSFPSKKGELVYNFNWQTFLTYAHNDYDPGYKTYWLTYSVEEREIIDENFVNEAKNFNVKDLPVGAILNFKDGETWKITKVIGNSSNPRGYMAAPYGKTKDHYISVQIEFAIEKLEDDLESVN